MKSKNKETEKPALPELKWPPLFKGTLIKRYKRFIADVALDNGQTVSAHCPNSGRMTGCSEPGRPVYLSFHDKPSRRLMYTWEIIDMGTTLVGVNTLVPNRLAAESVASGAVPELSGYETVRTEVKTGNSRMDLLLTGNGKKDCYVEVKNCTLVEEGRGLFPDAVTARGTKHLEELMRLKKEGLDAAMFFLVQRMDAKSFSPADEIDPAYGKALRKAADKGVELIAYDTVLTLSGIRINRALPVML